MNKLFSIFTAVIMTFFLCSCGNDGRESAVAFFEEYISKNGADEGYYIQISRTAAGENTLTEASKNGSDCAFMEYDIAGSLKFFRNDTLTEISARTYFAPDKTDAEWDDFEFEELNRKYRSVLDKLLEKEYRDSREVEFGKNDDKAYPKSVKIKYDVKALDTKELFSNGGNFGSVTVKFDADEYYCKFSNITVSCQYDYKDVIYIYAVTFGTPSNPDEKGKDGHRPEDIEKIFENYKKMIEQQMTST